LIPAIADKLDPTLFEPLPNQRIIPRSKPVQQLAAAGS